MEITAKKEIQMRQGVGVETLQVNLKKHSDLIKDFRGSTTMMTVSRTQGGEPIFNLDGVGTFEPTNLFHDQMAGHMEIPKKFYNRIKDNHSELWEHTVNKLIRDKDDEQRLVRTVGEKARAFLSTAYRRVDNFDVAGWFMKAMGERGGSEIFQTASLNMTDNYLYMKMTMPTILRGHVKAVGDIIEGGICLRNSEVGLGALKIERFYKRLICLNGMVRPFMSMRHLGKRDESETLQIEESQRTEKLEDALVISKLVDSIDVLMDKDKFDEELDMMRRGVEIDLSRAIAPPAKIVEVIGKRMSMSEGERDMVFENWSRQPEEEGKNAWSLVNAITRTAENVQNYDRATEFETMGFKVLQNGTKEWETIGREANELSVAIAA